MAMMDNVDFLVSHIRHSFITSDDTGMCELIIECDVNGNDTRGSRTFSFSGPLKREISNLSNVSDSGLDTSDGDLSHSLDILPDMDYGAHRRRSNTAQRLERLKKEKQVQGKIKTVSWKAPQASLTAEELGYLFEKKDIKDNTDLVQPQGPAKVMSGLTKQLENVGKMGENPFMEYARFDGRSSVGLITKKIDIFLCMAPPDQRPYPMTVVVMSSAKVQDLIGLICWQYTCEGREPKLEKNVTKYCLHIAEDDGEVDADFPSLDNREPVSKFGFTKLALVENKPSTPKSTFVVTVNIPNRGFNKFQLDTINIPMRAILQKVINRRKIRVRPGLDYNLEKQKEPGVAVDLDQTLAHMDTLEFCLVRENSTRGDLDEVPRNDSSNVADSLTSHQYKSYMVTMVHKLRANTDVHLGVSGEKVEIDPVAVRGTARLFRQRAVTYEADSIADCHLLEKKANGRAVFRMTYLISNDYKHHDFEADQDVALEIVQKLKNILELRLSPIRKDFIATQDRKVKKRDSLKYSV
ncbi:target of rapamycin complex 2 subunit MAPKAP1-like isoform X2 [Pomacea canaliculata]|uniref:target of rapamycin complex 2 subunit MAPKAP1-like isoform X2 n=1 Tax=Pomacea canaliculata TaxID=400727 RepID=UPI000D738952|nr:target of rapamycin complex 2 subunit MAPKAP1-like isoform X2 [Pomacea canaliculata]